MSEPSDADVERMMRVVLASVPDGVVGVYHARIYARAMLKELGDAAEIKHI